MANEVGTVLSKRLAKQAARRERAEQRREERAREVHEAALRRRRKVQLVDTPQGRRLTITARSELRAVGTVLAVGACFVCALVFAATSTHNLTRLLEAPWFLAVAGGSLSTLALCLYPWKVHVLLTPSAYAVYRFSPRLALRVGPRSELTIRNANHYGPRLQVGVERRWWLVFWGINNPKDRALIASLERQY